VKIGNPEQPNKKDPVGSFLLGYCGLSIFTKDKLRFEDISH
jgi:hypothetical protein